MDRRARDEAALMRCLPTPLAGLFELECPAHTDERGLFRRTWCQDEWALFGLNFQPIQTSLSDNTHRHTLRGMHYQTAPGEEQKLVRCLRGEVWDVVIDLRPDSATHGQSFSRVLSAERGNALFIPKGFAHGFLTLEDHCLLAYMIDAPYQPELACGLRWDDPHYHIDWPAAPQVIAAKDREWPLHV